MDFIVQLGFFILGGVAVLVYQFFQSKEVLKQTLYKEKFNLYTQLLKCIADMNAAITNRINGISEDDKILSETSKAFIRLIINNLHIFNSSSRNNKKGT
jgi:hypothetical protein